MKKVITRVEFEWDVGLQEYVVRGVPTSYYTNELFALCDSGDSGSDSTEENGVDPNTGDPNQATEVGQAGIASGYNPNGVATTVFDEDSITNEGGRSGTAAGRSTQEGRDSQQSSYAANPGAYNAQTDADYGFAFTGENATGLGVHDTILGQAQDWASRNGLFSQVGAGQLGFVNEAQNWMNANPGWTSLINTGLYFANPIAGMAGSLLTGAAAGRGGQSFGTTLGGLYGGSLGAAGGSFLGSLFDGKSTQQAVTGLATSALNYGINSQGLNFGNLLNNTLGNDRGSLASIATSQIGNMAQSAALGAGAGAVTNAVNSNFAGTSNLSTGVSNQGSAISSSGFNLAGGIDNNGGTGQFDLNKGIVGGGLSALGASLLTGNNNMATNDMSVGNAGGDFGSLGASLYGQYKDNYSDQLKNLSGASDPTQYNALLAQSYADPKSVYDSQYASMDKSFYGDMMANDSASGRTTDAYKHGLAREGQFQQFLQNYRSGLNTAAQGRLNNYTDLQKTALRNTQDLKNTSVNALSKLFGTNGSVSGGGSGSTLSNLFSQGTGAAGDYLKNLWNNYNMGSEYAGNPSYDMQLPEVDNSWYSDNQYQGTPSTQQEYEDYMANLDQ